MSAPSGLRKLVGLGNSGSSTNFLLSHLKAGNYFWSVQAVDPRFVGSPFAPEGTFAVGFVVTRSVFSTNNLFEATFNAEASSSYTLQTSADLANWEDLGSLLTTTNGIYKFTDNRIIKEARRFYRVLKP
jgi:hypothetical protein